LTGSPIIRARHDRPLRIDLLGKLSLELPLPQKALLTSKNITIIGDGLAGMNVSWQLALKGYEVNL
jgi:heterodisulfide reductase subunit A-like polyferredoxin